MSRSKIMGKRRQSMDLDIEASADGFVLTCARAPLLTYGGGAPVRHPARPLLEQMVNELDGQGSFWVLDGRIVEPRFFGAYSLFSVQKEWIESRQDELSTEFGQRLMLDPVLRPLPGPEQIDQYARWDVVDQWLGATLADLRLHALRLHNSMTDEDLLDSGFSAAELARIVSEAPVLIETLHRQYSDLPAEERSTIMHLHAIHPGLVLLPMALIAGRCTAVEYAMGVMAAHAVLSGVFSDVNDKAHQRAFQGVRADAQTALEYLQSFRSGMPEYELLQAVRAGESVTREFKSTLRWNPRSNQKDEDLTRAVVKTVAGFLNSEGGTLYIGVADDGQIVGIEQDKFENHDKFLLHLGNALGVGLGETAASLATASVRTIHGKSVCVVACSPSGAPVYYEGKGHVEEFFIRQGPGTRSLPPREVVAYVSRRFAR